MRAWIFVAVALAGCGRVGFDAVGGPGDVRGDTPITFGDGITTTMNVMFLTSTRQNAADLLGLDGADMLCANLAYGQLLPGTFVAWLSDATHDAKSRVAGSRGWVRSDGMLFAASPDALIAGQIMAPPILDELGMTPLTSLVVTTATDATGTLTGGDCGAWTSPGLMAVTGDPTSTTASWTAASTAACGTNSRLYCFAIDP